ncbi:hypothetical protein [Arthrobacter sp. CJ23]|uniref:hypothetical protein n=1 Tax=Arthrobacter sp. CJ23 TaxID=2972479 RepID=UPI00215C82AC|nr:hypothetical protein [Arthrobacter sp. CJ23]UVJ39410.1 hypothetical protein NVV90_19800 [Arthrobacter sp. CJ23]
MAGVAAMACAIPLAYAMGLNFVATFTFACVVFVAVAMWVESKIARRRSAGDAAATADAPISAADPAESDDVTRD